MLEFIVASYVRLLRIYTHTSRSFTSKDLIRCSASVYGAVSRLPTLLFPVHIYLSAIPTSRSEHQHTINRNKRTRNMSYMYTLFIFVHLVGRCWLHVCMSELVHVYTVRRWRLWWSFHVVRLLETFLDM